MGTLIPARGVLVAALVVRPVAAQSAVVTHQLDCVRVIFHCEGLTAACGVLAETPSLGTLTSDESRVLDVRLSAGRTDLFVGVYDEDGEDLDLSLRDVSGEATLAEAVEGDNPPIIRVWAPPERARRPRAAIRTGASVRRDRRGEDGLHLRRLTGRRATDSESARPCRRLVARLAPVSSRGRARRTGPPPDRGFPAGGSRPPCAGCSRSWTSAA